MSAELATVDLAPLYTALAAAQGAIHAVGKDGKNTHMNYAYTSSEAVIDAARTALSPQGLAAFRLKYEVPESSGNNSARLGFYTINAGSTYAPRITLAYPGAMASERKEPSSAEDTSDSTMCGSTIQDVLGISLDASGEEAFEIAEEVTCTAD